MQIIKTKEVDGKLYELVELSRRAYCDVCCGSSVIGLCSKLGNECRGGGGRRYWRKARSKRRRTMAEVQAIINAGGVV